MNDAYYYNFRYWNENKILITKCPGDSYLLAPEFPSNTPIGIFDGYDTGFVLSTGTSSFIDYSFFVLEPSSPQVIYSSITTKKKLDKRIYYSIVYSYKQYLSDLKKLQVYIEKIMPISPEFDTMKSCYYDGTFITFPFTSIKELLTYSCTINFVVIVDFKTGHVRETKMYATEIQEFIKKSKKVDTLCVYQLIMHYYNKFISNILLLKNNERLLPL